MKITISKTPALLGIEAAKLAASSLNRAIFERGEARLVLSTGASQFETLEALLKEDVDWERTEIFHLDEYMELPVTHKASFRKYLNDRITSRIRCKRFHSIDTEEKRDKLLERLTMEIRKNRVDLGLIGIGENAHIAFNDPPADFKTRDAFQIVTLDQRCRLQQVREGWFESVDDVPSNAVSMTVWQIMQCQTIISAVPHRVKAEAVNKTLTNPVDKMIPATILKQHNDFNLFLDTESSSGIITF